MLLEEGEFVQYKGSKQVRWIEKVDTQKKMITLGKMEYKDYEFVKTFILMTWEEFYEKFEDIK